MIAKCSCQHCGSHIEFEAEQSGMVVICPHCGKETTLGIVRPAQPAPKITPVLKTSEAKRENGKSLIFGVVASFLLVVSIGSNILLLNRKPAPSQEPKLQKQLAELKQQLEEKHQQLVAALQANVTQDQKAIEATVCGIYEFQETYMNSVASTLDIRSDYTALVSMHGTRARNETWHLTGDKIQVSGFMGTLSIEGDDLIDSKGNRWLRTR